MHQPDKTYTALRSAAFHAVCRRLEVNAFRVCLETILGAMVLAVAAFALLDRLVPGRGAWLGTLAALGLVLLGWLIGHLRGHRFRVVKPLTAEDLFPRLADYLTRATGGVTDFVGLSTRPESYDASIHAWAIRRWVELHERGYPNLASHDPSLVRLALGLGLAVTLSLLVVVVAYDPGLDASAPLAKLDPNNLTLPLLLLTLAVVWFALCLLSIVSAGLGSVRIDLEDEEVPDLPPLPEEHPLPTRIPRNRLPIGTQENGAQRNAQPYGSRQS